MMVFRFVISPALGAALCALLGIGGRVRSVYVVELAMPVMTQTVVAAAEYGADEQLAQFVEREKYLQEREQRLGVTDETLAELTEWLRGLEF